MTVPAWVITGLLDSGKTTPVSYTHLDVYKRQSLYYSFTDYSFGSQYDFVGLANYLQIFTKDREVKNSLAVTFKFVFMSVPMKLISALIIAMLLNQALKGIGLFRTIYYLPSILGGSVAIAILWLSLIHI